MVSHLIRCIAITYWIFNSQWQFQMPIQKSLETYWRHHIFKSNNVTSVICLHAVKRLHYHHHHHVVPLAQISLTLSCHFSISFITSGRFSGLHPVSSHSCCMYVWAGRPAFARLCVYKQDLTLNYQQGLIWP